MSYEAHRQLSVPFRATSAHRGPVIADLRHNTSAAKRYTFFFWFSRASSPTGMSSGYVIGTDVPAAQSTRNGVSVRFMFVQRLMDLEEIGNGLCMSESLRVYVVMVRSKERPGFVIFTHPNLVLLAD